MNERQIIQRINKRNRTLEEEAERYRIYLKNNKLSGGTVLSALNQVLTAQAELADLKHWIETGKEQYADDAADV